MTTDRLLRVSEVARMCNVSGETVYTRIRRGELPVVRFGPKSTRIRRADLDAFMERQAEIGDSPFRLP